MLRVHLLPQHSLLLKLCLLRLRTALRTGMQIFSVLKYFPRVTVEVVGREGEPVSVSALIDGGQPWRRGYGGNVVYTDWARHG